VEFRLKLRDEMKFASFDELKARIQLDARAAREYLRVAPPGLD
jgi:riboflavin kinase/FMN adenylyltransferase